MSWREQDLSTNTTPFRRRDKIKIRVRVYSILKETLGTRSVSTEIRKGGTLGDVLNKLDKEYGEAFYAKTGRKLNQALRDRFNLFLNNKRLELTKDLDLKLKDEDEIAIFQPVGGG